MKLKSKQHRTREIIFLVGASLLTLLLIVYLFYLVSTLNRKANSVFGKAADTPGIQARFDFDRYDRVINSIFPEPEPESESEPESEVVEEETVDPESEIR